MTGAEITVERVTALDENDCADLCAAAEAAILDGGGFGWLKPPKRTMMESFWQGVLLVPERHLFVGRWGGAIAGAVQLVPPARNNEAQSFAVQLTTLFVAPTARRHGLGRRLVEAAEAGAAAAGRAVVNMDIRATQAGALALAESLGYTRWGTHPAYARVDGEIVAGHFYYKKLL